METLYRTPMQNTAKAAMRLMEYNLHAPHEAGTLDGVPAVPHRGISGKPYFHRPIIYKGVINTNCQGVLLRRWANEDCGS